jgi:hypothetical protein
MTGKETFAILIIQAQRKRANERLGFHTQEKTEDSPPKKIPLPGQGRGTIS